MIEHFPFDKFDVSAVQRAKKNKSCCGDSFFIHETSDYLICALADGLGSGQGAHDASIAAVDVVRDHHEMPLDQLMEIVNRSLFHLRGAVVTIFRVDYHRKVISVCGVGNIKLLIFPEQGKAITPFSKPGFLSGRPLNFNVQEFPYPDNGMFLIHSDGINLMSRQIPAIKSLYYADDSAETGNYLRELVKYNENDDMTLLIGKPLM